MSLADVCSVNFKNGIVTFPILPIPVISVFTFGLKNDEYVAPSASK